MTTVEQVIEHYRQCARAAHRQLPRRPHERYPEDRATAEAYLRWCAQHEIDPLYFITDRLTWVWNQHGRLQSFRALRCDSCVGPYRDRERAWQLARASAGAARTQSSELVQRVRDVLHLLPSQESVRLRYWQSQDAALCMASTDISGGFDPRSRVCPACPLAAQCAATLKQQHGFDAVALRARQYQALPAEIAKIARGQRDITV